MGSERLERGWVELIARAAAAAAAAAAPGNCDHVPRVRASVLKLARVDSVGRTD